MRSEDDALVGASAAGGRSAAPLTRRAKKAADANKQKPARKKTKRSAD